MAEGGQRKRAPIVSRTQPPKKIRSSSRSTHTRPPAVGEPPTPQAVSRPTAYRHHPLLSLSLSQLPNKPPLLLSFFTPCHHHPHLLLLLLLILTALTTRTIPPIMSPSPPSSPSTAAAAAAAPPLPVDPSALALLTPTIASPSPIAALPAPNNPNPNPSSNRRLPPPCWTNEETLALIESYRDKWYSLRRGNLRAAHWDEVADAVARRCSHLPTATPKTSVQCRHKIEKLRKRYRSERQRSLSHDPTAIPSSPWIFFNNMDQMENPNPNPNSHHRPSHHPQHHQDPESDYNDDDEIDDASIYSHHRRPLFAANGGGSGGGGELKFKIPKAVRSSRAIPVGIPNPGYGGFSKGFVKPGMEEMRRRLEAKRRRKVKVEDEEEVEEGGEAGAMGDIVRALRGLGDGYMRMEQMKMDLAREMERGRMEMELKRTEMILDTQRRIVDSFVKGFLGEKKVKRSQDS